VVLHRERSLAGGCVQTIGTPSLWIAFTVFVLSMLALDLGVFHRRAHALAIREALAWTVAWIVLALVFNAGVYFKFGPERGMEFLTGYLIEKALSVDNIFVFLVIFTYFAVPAAFQHRVLFWGILGAMILRGVFIFLGTALIQRFHWIIYVFGAFLIFTGIKLFVQRASEVHPERNPLFQLFRRVFPSVPEFRGAHFLVVDRGKWYATPLLLVLMGIEVTDIAFAFDSIPAIFAITTDPFIVYTSNIFAILGLRALYFVLAGVMTRFCYLNLGLSLVLTFVGGKMLLGEFYKVPISVSLAVVALLLAGSILASLLRNATAPQASTDVERCGRFRQNWCARFAPEEGPAMLSVLESRVKSSFGRAEAAAETVLHYLAEYGLRIVVLSCLLAGLALLVWAHWAV
jgi:TerC family integral membrane protein